MGAARTQFQKTRRRFEFEEMREDVEDDPMLAWPRMRLTWAMSRPRSLAKVWRRS